MATKQAQYSAPQQTANRTFRLPLVGTFQNRGGGVSKDQRLVNCFPESEKHPITEAKKAYATKRPGMSLRRAYTAGSGRGVFRWKGADYVAVGGVLYKDAVSHQALSGTSGPVGFEVVFDGGTEKLFFCDGTDGFVTNGTTVVKIPQTYTIWLTLTTYSAGVRKIPTVANGFFYEVVVGGTTAAGEPVWPTVIDDQVLDGTVVWKCAGYYGFAYDDWPPADDPIVGERIVPSVSNGFFYECIVGGAVAGTEPVWPVTIGNTIVDGAATWRCEGVVDVSEPMPKAHLPYPVFLDGTLYLIAKNPDGTNTQSIYNSGVKRPHSWNQIDFTDAEQYSDTLVALVRHHNTIAAFGTDSLEFFYDRANPTGSPLERNDTLSVKLGCPAPQTAKQTEKTLIFVGTSTHGGYGVWQIENYTPKKISDEFIDKILEVETTISSARAYFVRVSGHLFYVLRLSNQTLVYDPEEKLWHEWTSNSGGSHVSFTGAYAHDLGNGKSLLLGSSDGNLYVLDPTVYQDNSVSILVDIYTTKLDFESINRKFIHRLVVLADEISGETVNVRWTDDDYRTWSDYFPVSLADSPMELRRLGVLRRRAFHLAHSGNSALRVEGIEVDVSLGNH
jgi:hypothetical protein